MKNNTKTSIFSIAFIAVISIISLSACSSQPQLKQVESDAPEKPINTPESAGQLKKKYEK